MVNVSLFKVFNLLCNVFPHISLLCKFLDSCIFLDSYEYLQPPARDEEKDVEMLGRSRN
jgi:hypothetical protein